MTRLNWYGVAVLLGVVTAALGAVAAYDGLMLYRHGRAGTVSAGMNALGKEYPLFAAFVGAAFVGGAMALCVHWFDG